MFYRFSFFVLFVALCFQNVILFYLNSIPVKPYHLVLFFVCLFNAKSSLLIPRNCFWILILVLISFILSFFSFLLYSFSLNPFLLNYIFCCILLVFVSNASNYLDENAFFKVLKKSVIFIYFICLINILLQIDRIFSFVLNPIGHPLIEVIFGGGVNLEATYLGIFATIFKNDKKKIFIYILSVLISCIYASRVGLVIDILVGLFLFYGHLKKFLFLYLSLFLSVITVLLDLSFIQYIFNRFVSIGNEPGSISRIRLWSYFMDTVSNYPFGVGLGNCTSVISMVTGDFFYENNFHNLYMQMFIDLGVIGGLVFVSFCLCFIFINRKTLFSNCFLFIIFIYLLFSFIQFRGAEPIIFFFIGCYYSIKRNAKQFDLVSAD